MLERLKPRSKKFFEIKVTAELLEDSAAFRALESSRVTNTRHTQSIESHRRCGSHTWLKLEGFVEQSV